MANNYTQTRIYGILWFDSWFIRRHIFDAFENDEIRDKFKLISLSRITFSKNSITSSLTWDKFLDILVHQCIWCLQDLNWFWMYLQISIRISSWLNTCHILIHIHLIYKSVTTMRKMLLIESVKTRTQRTQLKA